MFFSASENSVAQRLMKEMGWEKGKGLGATGQGEKDPIHVKMNIESRGMNIVYCASDGTKLL